jgi:hypothetical protein
MMKFSHEKLMTKSPDEELSNFLDACMECLHGGNIPML